MFSKITIAISSAVLLFACLPENSQTRKVKQDKPAQTSAVKPAQKACQDEQYRQLDFWLGEWELEWDQADGSKGTGRNSITKAPYGDCVITENFNGAPTMQFKGMSVSTYHKPAGQWRQTWVDDQGGYFALYGGPDGEGKFALEMTRLAGKGPHRRMVWKDIKENSLTWHWQGRKEGESAWKDLWVIRYNRQK